VEIKELWTDFISDCGGETIVENYVHAKTIFTKKYENNIVTWTGYFAEAKNNNAINWFNDDHALNIMVKMSPSESALFPDLVLSVSSRTLNAKREMITGLKKGDEIKFRANFK